MNVSATQNTSIMFDNGEYFFDDDFSVPFDANLRRDPVNGLTRQLSRSGIVGPSLGESGEFGECPLEDAVDALGSSSTKLVHARSDTCLLQKEGLLPQNGSDAKSQGVSKVIPAEELLDPEGCGELNLSDFPSEPLFSPNQSMFLSTQSELSASLMGQSMDQQTRQLLKASYIRENYQLTFDSQRPQPVTTSMRRDTEDVRSSRCWSDSSGSNLSTWASMAAQKKSQNASTKTMDRSIKESNQCEDVRPSSPAPSSTQTTWGQRKQRSSADLGSSEFERRTNPTLSGTTLLEMYSNMKGYELRSTQSRDALHHILPPVSLEDEDDRDYLPVRRSRTHEDTLGGATRIRKARSFSNRPRPQGLYRPEGKADQHRGAGAVSLPRSSKLEAQAFLSSKTLPDLSFLSSLSTSGTLVERKTQDTTSTRRRVAHVKASKAAMAAVPIGPTTVSGDSGFDSTTDHSVSAAILPRRSSAPHCGKGTMIRDSFHETHMVFAEPFEDEAAMPISKGVAPVTSNTFDGSIDISVHEVGDDAMEDVRITPIRKPISNHVPSSPMKKSSSEIRLTSGAVPSVSNRPLKSCLVRRSSSSIAGAGFGGLDRTVSMPTAINDSVCTADSEELYETLNDHERRTGEVGTETDGESADGFRVKKSVSFSERIQLVAMEEAVSNTPSILSKSLNMPQRAKCIPRHWGLYGQDPLLAEFPLSSGNSTEAQQEMDSRMCALVNDVMAAVQRLHQGHAHLLQQVFMEAAAASPTLIPVMGVSVNFPPELGCHPLLVHVAMELVAALNRLLLDGLEPPPRQFFSKKPRSRLWNFVEESCKPGCNHRAAMEALRETKSSTNISSEKCKFRAFIFTCLNGKALGIWFGHLLTNESLLKRFYCEDAFLRQVCTVISAHSPPGSGSPSAALQLLVTELVRSLESLITIPFQLPLAALNASEESRSSEDSPQSSRLAQAPSQASVNSTPRNVAPQVSTTSRRSPQPSGANLPPSLASKFRNRPPTTASATPPQQTQATALRRPASATSTAPSKFVPNVPGVGPTSRRSQPLPRTTHPSNESAYSNQSNETSPSTAAVPKMSWEKRAATTTKVGAGVTSGPGAVSNNSPTGSSTRIPTSMRTWAGGK